MKILLACQNYRPFVGGVETHAHQVAHELSQKHDVTVVAVNFTPSRLPRRLAFGHESVLTPEFKSYDDDGVPVHALTPTFVDRVRMAPILVRATPWVSRVAYHELRRFGYLWYRPVVSSRLDELASNADVVHSLAGGYLGWAVQEAASKRRIPFICTPFVHPEQWGDGPEDISYYQKADAVIGLIESDRDYLESIGVSRGKLKVIGVSPDLPPTTDPESFRTRTGINGAPIVLYVGRMMPKKGARAVLEATSHVWDKRPDVHFVFIGPALPQEKAWFEDCDPRIHYLGKVSLQEKADALAACDVFCMPSISEILPTVYLEAWSYGKPVVGGTAPGLPALVQGNNAGTVAPQNGMDVAAALLPLLQDPDSARKMGQQGKSLVEDRYSVAAVTGALETLYREVSKTRIACS